MRILLGVLLLTAAALTLPDDREVAAAKEKVQAMLDEAALLEQAGRKEDAARVREEAAALKQKIEGRGGPGLDDPRMQALHNLEKTIVALDKAGYEGMARQAREMADRLRADIKGRGAEGAKPRGDDADFWRRNLETLAVAMKGLSEAERRDAADMVERAIHARKLMLEGRKDEEAQQIIRKGPDDGQLAELLLKAAGCWREFKQPEKAMQCEELGRFLADRAGKGVDRAVGLEPKERRQGPGPEDRLARVEERLDRMERMLQSALERLEERERGRDRERGEK